MNWQKIRFSRRKLSQFAHWCWLQKMPHPQFHGENVCEWLQNLEIDESFMLRLFLSCQKYFSHYSYLPLSELDCRFIVN